MTSLIAVMQVKIHIHSMDFAVEKQGLVENVERKTKKMSIYGGFLCLSFDVFLQGRKTSEAATRMTTLVKIQGIIVERWSTAEITKRNANKLRSQLCCYSPD